MIEVRGPDNPKQLKFDSKKNSFELSDEKRFFVKATCLKEALDAYCQFHNTSYRKYDGSIDGVPLISKNGKRRFFFTSNDPRLNDSVSGEMLVDIHIEDKDGIEICLKQNLTHILKHGDIVIIGMPAC